VTAYSRGAAAEESCWSSTASTKRGFRSSTTHPAAEHHAERNTEAAERDAEAAALVEPTDGMVEREGDAVYGMGERVVERAAAAPVDAMARPRARGRNSGENEACACVCVLLGVGPA
jgi:hypothetical protein